MRRTLDRRCGEQRRRDLPGRVRQHERRGVCRLDRLLRELTGIHHVGVSAQDDWQRSYKDTKRIAPYLPSFAGDLANRDRSKDPI